MNPILALFVEPVLKVLAKAGVRLAKKVHEGPMHNKAEAYRKDIEAAEAAKKAVKVLILMTVLSMSGCMAYKRAFVAIHDSIDEALNDKPKTEEVKK